MDRGADCSDRSADTGTCSRMQAGQMPRIALRRSSTRRRQPADSESFLGSTKATKLHWEQVSWSFMTEPDPYLTTEGLRREPPATGDD